MWTLVRVLGLFGVAGCNCRPDPTVPSMPIDDTAPPPAATADTAPPPRCAIEESEVNNEAATADELPLDRRGCGLFQAPNDPDFWTFDVPESAWVGVWLDARENGSIADPGLFVVGPGGLVVARDDGDETADVRLLFPAPVGTYTLTVREEGFQGAEDGRYFYDLLATVQKAPLEWTGLEVEPNDAVAQATPAGPGDVLLGALADPDDDDVFRVAIPVGRHELTARIDAFTLGSPADLMMNLVDAGGSSPGCGASNPSCEFRRGEVGFERDPWLQYTSEGDEVLYVRVRSEDGFGSPIHWYALSVALVAP